MPYDMIWNDFECKRKITYTPTELHCLQVVMMSVCVRASAGMLLKCHPLLPKLYLIMGTGPYSHTWYEYRIYSSSTTSKLI